MKIQRISASKKKPQHTIIKASHSVTEMLDAFESELAEHDIQSSSKVCGSIELSEDEKDELWDLIDKYNSSSPVSGDWDTETADEQKTIAEHFNISLDDAKQIMIDYLGFEPDDAFADSTETAVTSSSTVVPGTREDSMRLVDEWYNEETYPEYADRLPYAREIFWDGVNMEDVECFLEGNNNIDLSQVDSVRYMDDDEFAIIEDEGYEGGYIITYKNGEVKAYGWQPYQWELDEIPDLVGNAEYYKNKKAEPFADAMQDYNERVADEAYRRK